MQVSLDNPFDADNSTAMKSKQKLKCKAEHSISKPEFSWFVEDTKLEISEEVTFLSKYASISRNFLTFSTYRTSKLKTVTMSGFKP